MSSQAYKNLDNFLMPISLSVPLPGLSSVHNPGTRVAESPALPAAFALSRNHSRTLLKASSPTNETISSSRFGEIGYCAEIACFNGVALAGSERGDLARCSTFDLTAPSAAI